MSLFSMEQIAQIIQGEILSNPHPGVPIRYLSTDSRTVAEGKETLFFALSGTRNDGHRYLEELLKKGITGVVISRWPSLPGITEKTAVLNVENTLHALQKLAAFQRRKWTGPVVGITGSNGKTVVKEWLYELLREDYAVIRSPKSYNSQIGVPLSVWLLQENHNLALFEAGISKPGEMEKLEEILRPDVGILTNIGSAHQENFTSLKQKTREKLLLFRKSKKLVFCADQGETSSEAETFCEKHGVEKINWSLKHKPALIRFSAATGNPTRITASLRETEYAFSIPFTDVSSLENACHCFSAMYALDVPLKKVLQHFSRLTAIAMRLEIKKGKNHCILINDSYNSDINALSIALTSLKNQASKKHFRKILILSDIKQSGIGPSELYATVRDMAKQAGVFKVVGIGPDLHSVSGIFDPRDAFFRDTESFLRSSSFADWNHAAILIKGARDFHFERISEVLQEKAHQTVLEIDMNALVDNLNTFRSLLHPGTRLMAMVKAFSYGSGITEIARLLEFHGIDALAVAVTDEGVELRNAGISVPIVVMNPEVHSFQTMLDFKLEPNLYSRELLTGFSQAARANAWLDFPVHIKIDTGMNRLGFKTKKEAKEMATFIKKTGTLKIHSVFSHLAGSDDPELDSFTEEQLRRFDLLSSIFLDAFDYPILRHILNSAGIERFSQYQYDMVRLGIGLYGISATRIPLKNISTLKTTVSQVKEVKQNESIGYGRQGRVTRPSTIAVIPIGYADGLARRLGNGTGRAWVKNTYVPIIGNICMDMCMLDITGMDVKAGDEAELLGPHIPVTELAAKTGTIPYEIFTGISQRVKRVYLQE